MRVLQFGLLSFWCCCRAALLSAQVSVSGGQLFIQEGTTVAAGELSLLTSGNAAIINQGALTTSADISNAANATLSGNGTWQLAGNWTNAGTFIADTSVVRFAGNAASTVNPGGAPFFHLQLNKNARRLILAAPVTANGTIRFLTDNNQVLCGNFDFTVGNTASVVGADNDSYFVTNGTGFLKRQGLAGTAFAFPVGADTLTENLLILAENGDPDVIGVRCMQQPLANGTAGLPINANAVNTAWEVVESTNGGSNLSATAYWGSADELAGFIRTSCGIARFNSGIDWDLPAASLAPALGSDPYTRVRNNLQPGIFTVLDEAYVNGVKLALRLLLQGPYNPSTMKMNDNLRILPAFPLSAPATYGAGKFLYTGWQPSGGYSIDPSILSITGDNAIVDWIFLWLKDPNNPATVLHSRAALLQKDGDVVDIDGVSPVRFPVGDGNYLVAAGHRNHLSVRSPNGSGIALSEATVTPYDFSTALTQAYGTNPMKQVQTTPSAIFALWGGNTSVNNTVRASGPPAINDFTVLLNTLGFATNVLFSVYSNADINMDGTVRMTGPPAINDYTKLLTILGATTNIITEQQ